MNIDNSSHNGKTENSSDQVEDDLIFNAYPDAVFILSSTGQILKANLAAVQRYGYSLEELKRMKALDLAPPNLRDEAVAHLRQALKSGNHFEWRHRRKDGSELPVEILARPIVHLGEPAIISSVRDISPRKEVEFRLAEQKHLLEQVLETEPGTVYIFDLNKQANVYINRFWLSAYGYTPEETQAMGGELLARLFHPDDLERIINSHESFRDAADGEMRTIEYRCRDKAGTWHWLSSRETPFARDELGRVNQILGIAHDITESKQTEILIGKQQQVLEMIASGAPLPEVLTALVRFIEAQSPGLLGSILLLDEDGIHVRLGAAPSLPDEFNAAVDGQPIGPSAGSCGTAAYRKQAVFVTDIATDPLWADYKAAALPHGLRACWSTPIFDVTQRVLGTFAMYYRQPGLPQPEHFRLIDAATHVAAIAIERYRQDEILRKSEVKFRTIIEASPVALAINDEHQNITLLNRKFVETFGYTQADIPTLTAWWPRAYPDPVNRQRVAQEWQAAVEKAHRDNTGIEPMEYRVSCKDSSVREIRFSMALLDGSNLVVLDDITERKQNEQARAELTHLLSEAQRIGHIGSFNWNIATGQIQWSDECYRLYGVQRDSFTVTAESGITCIHPEDQPKAQKWARAHVAGEEPYPLTYRTVWPDGNIHWLVTDGELQRGTDGAPSKVIGTIQDITERMQTENSLVESEQRYRTLFENMNSSFALYEVVQDDQGVPVDFTIMACNKQFGLDTDLNSQEIIGKRLAHVLPSIKKSSLDLIGLYGQVALRGAPHQFEIESAQKPGTYYSIIAFQAAPKQCPWSFLTLLRSNRRKRSCTTQ